MGNVFSHLRIKKLRVHVKLVNIWNIFHWISLQFHKGLDQNLHVGHLSNLLLQKLSNKGSIFIPITKSDYLLMIALLILHFPSINMQEFVQANS